MTPLENFQGRKKGDGPAPRQQSVDPSDIDLGYSFLLKTEHSTITATVVDIEDNGEWAIVQYFMVNRLVEQRMPLEKISWKPTAQQPKGGAYVYRVTPKGHDVELDSRKQKR